MTPFIALVWLVNGLVCKVLNLVPRHQQIVARILGPDQARLLTVLIGSLEILMTVWILSGIQPRLCTWVQVIVILAMNILEFILAPDLLLFGRMNLVFALLFAAVILWNNHRYYITHNHPI